ncbi:sulfatase [Pelobium sp.]|nr:sulfatase [Pelobium sp.]MDA9555457.1 sulfatase [Pelobium sp.]
MEKTQFFKKYKVKVLLIVLVLMNLGFSKPQEPAKKKMNIVFLLADDLRWNSLGCMGNNIVVTPNIDKIAAQGIKFNNAAVTTPICCCSRASILTGQYMSRNKVENFSTVIPADNFINTYPGVLRNAGYYTGFVGKYGVGKVRESDFDFSSIYEGKHWYPVNQSIQVVKLNKRGKPLPNQKIIGDSIHVTDRNANDAIQFLRTRPKDKPFNLSVSFYAPHAEDPNPAQYRYKPSSEKYYQDVAIPVPSTSNEEALKALPPFISNEKNGGRIRWHWRFDSPEKYQKYMKAYYRLITDVDVAVGKIIAELKKQGEYENTLIVFMGDNGYFQSDHELADKWYPYEESIRVPLIIYDPRLPSASRGTSNDEFALNIDIAPTILAAAGVNIPEVIQGKNLSPLYLSKKKTAWRQDFYVEHPVIVKTEFIPASEAVVTHNEKYINWPFYNYEEYFDLKKDPKETHNLFNDPSKKQNIDLLKKRMLELKEQAK